MPKRTVIVNDKMQKRYRYERTAAVGRNFDPEFKPELTPQQMLRLGVFCGKYMTDTRKEFPKSWFTRARLSPRGRDCSLNFFGVDASQPLSVWRRKGWLHPDDPRGLVPVVLPLLHRPPHAGRGPPPDQAMESHSPAYPADRAALRAGRPDLPPAAAAGAPALGL
jgi:hypothetical protein